MECVALPGVILPQRPLRIRNPLWSLVRRRSGRHKHVQATRCEQPPNGRLSPVWRDKSLLLGHRIRLAQTAMLGMTDPDRHGEILVCTTAVSLDKGRQAHV